MAGQKGRSGGPRPGAGRTRKNNIVSEMQKEKWLEAAEQLAEDHGKTVEFVVLEMVYDKDVQDSVRIAAAKLYTEALIERGMVGDPTVDRPLGPVVGLPPLRPDPALKIVRDGD
jgi:hypothetical protein